MVSSFLFTVFDVCFNIFPLLDLVDVLEYEIAYLPSALTVDFPHFDQVVHAGFYARVLWVQSPLQVISGYFFAGVCV